MLLASRDTEANLKAYYAADAGVESVLNDLVNGREPTPAPLTLNDLAVTVIVTIPSGSKPGGIYQYLDPEPEPATGLSPLQKRENPLKPTVYSFKIENVEASSIIQVNWPFTVTQPIPLGSSWIALEVDDASGEFIGSSVKLWPPWSPMRLLVEDLAAGSYTVKFINGTIRDLYALSYNSQGGDYTWVWARSYKDYLISSTSNGVTINCYARQAPGLTIPSTVPQTVQIYSWQVQ